MARVLFKMNYFASCCIYSKDKIVKINGQYSEKTTCGLKSAAASGHPERQTAIHVDVFVVRVHLPAVSTPSCLFLFLFNILKLDVSYAVSMNMKSIQIKPKGKDTVLGPLIQLDAALFGALCW